MTAAVYVTSLQEYQTWLQQQKASASPTPPPASPTSVPSATFQQLAAAGQPVFASSCAICHGTNGQGGVGPALWGPNATLGKIAGTTLFPNNAQSMLNFISTNMPLSAPGSLTHQQYIDLLCYILVQDQQVSPSTMFVERQLGTITLK